jgi:hypothetical protein
MVNTVVQWAATESKRCDKLVQVCISVPWILTQSIKRLEQSDAMASRDVHRRVWMHVHHLDQRGINKYTLNIQTDVPVWSRPQQ